MNFFIFIYLYFIFLTYHHHLFNITAFFTKCLVVSKISPLDTKPLSKGGLSSAGVPQQAILPGFDMKNNTKHDQLLKMKILNFNSSVLLAQLANIF